MCIMYCVYNFLFFSQVAQLNTSNEEEVKSINLFLFTAVYKILDSVTEMLSTLKWKTLEIRRTIVCLSTCMLYEMRYRLVSHEDAKLDFYPNR